MAGKISLRPSKLFTPLVGLLLAGSGIMVLAGWIASRPSWTTLGLTDQPVSIASAVGFLVCGAALFALDLGSRRIPFYLGGATALLALALFSRYALEQLLEVRLDMPPPSPGLAQALLATPPNSALAFALAGFALALSRRAVGTQALIGALVLTLGSVALLGHLTRVASAFTWGAHEEMSLQTALGLALLGAALVGHSLARHGSGARAPWLPLAAGVATILAGALFWQALRGQEMEAFHRTIDATVTAAGQALEARLEPMFRAGDQIAAQGTRRGWREPGAWEESASLLLGSLPGFRSLHWLERPATVPEPEPLSEDAAPEPRDELGGRGDAEPGPGETGETPVDRQTLTLRAAVLDLVGRGRRPAVVGPLPAGDQGTVGVLIPIPGSWDDGLLLATFDAQEVFSPLAARGAPGYDFQVLCQGVEVFRRGGVPEVDERWVRTAALGFSGPLDWELRLEPTARLMSAQRTGFPELALGVGALLAVLLTFTVRLGEVETRRARAFEEEVRQRTGELEEALASLRAQIRQRQRSEDRLRRSQEVARLLSGELDVEALAQGVTDAATGLTGATFGIFLYQAPRKGREQLAGCALSGIGAEALGPLAEPGPAWPHPRALVAGRCLRLADLPRDSGKAEREDLPFAHLPLRSYLAVPVRSRSGELHGGLYLGHAEAAVFSQQEEEIAVTLAAQTAVAMDNATLYDAERRAKAAAEAANASKDRFLATLGHELRNPLGSISTALEVLALQPREEALERRMRDIVARQVRQLARLVDDLLDVSRIERGKIAVRLERVELLDLVRETAESHRPELEASSLRLGMELPSEEMWVDADPTRLAQVLSNLLGNAAKFTDAGGEVRVTLERQGRRAVVSVQDTGCGLTPDELAQVFEPFAQAESASSRMAGGLGLGLTIARSLVEAHGGALEAASAGPGRGSELTFTVPLRRPPARGEAPPPPAPEALPLRVLVVDDHEDAALGLAQLLSLMGHQTEVAHDGAGGLAAAKRWRPDLVISDLGMPGMDGFELAQRLSREISPPRPWLCALSGYGDEAAARRAREAGFDHHLTKPVERAQLDRVLLAARQREVTPPSETPPRSASRSPAPGR